LKGGEQYTEPYVSVQGGHIQSSFNRVFNANGPIYEWAIRDLPQQ